MKASNLQVMGPGRACSGPSFDFGASNLGGLKMEIINNEKENLPDNAVEQLLKKVTENELIELLYKKSQYEKELENIIKSQEDKVDFYDKAMASDDLMEMADIAKIIKHKGLGRTKLFKFLRDRGILRMNNIPYQRFIDAGYFTVIEQVWIDNNLHEHLSLKTMTTQKGLDFIRKQLNKEKE